jgi:anti-sigma B factor antagonist
LTADNIEEDRAYLIRCILQDLLGFKIFMGIAMEINIKNIQDIVSLELAGKLDVDGARELKKTIINLLKSNKKLLHLNLSRINYINSLGLGVLVSIFQEIENIDGRITFAQPNKYVSELLDSTHLSQVFDIYENDTDALESFNHAKISTKI